MVKRNILCFLHITLPDRFYQFFMLTDKEISGLLFLQIFHTVAVHLLAEIIQYLVQTLVIGSLVNDLMERHIRLRKTNKISLCFCFLEFFGCYPEPSKLLLCDQLTCLFYGYILKRDTHLKNIVQIFFGDACNLGSPAWDHHYKAFLLQLTHGLTHRCSADTQTLCKSDLQKSLPRFQFSFQNCLPQGVKNNIPKWQILIHIHRKITCHL